MNTTTALTGFTAALALTFGGAWALGSSIGPDAPEVAEHGSAHSTPKEEDAMGTDTLPAGLAVARDGYALDLGTTSVGAGRQEVAFTIRDVTGVPVTVALSTPESARELTPRRRASSWSTCTRTCRAGSSQS